MTNAHMIDISYAQPVASINWPRIHEQNIGVIIRAGQSSYEDALFRQHYAGAIAAQVPAGMYWFYQPDMRPEYQAAACISVWDSLPVKPKVIALDVEPIVYTGVSIFPPSPETHTVWLQAWLDDVEQATGIIPTIYTRKDYWDAWLLRKPTWKRYPLWIASWLVYAQDIRLPVDWSSWHIWQYEGGTGRTDGVTGPVDQNEYNGDYAAMVKEFGGTEAPTMTTLYKQTTPQTGRAKVLTYNTTQKMTVTPDQLGNELVVLPMGGMDFWDGSHMRLYSVQSFKGRRAEFAGANIPVGGRFMIDAGYWLKEQHTAPEVISQSCGGNMDEIQKQASARANLCLPHLFDAWCDGAWTWDSIFNKTAKFADIKFLELGMIATEGFAGAGIGDYWQTISFQHLSQPLNWLKLRGYIPNIPLVMYTGPWWLSLYQGGEFATMLANAKTWLYFHLGQWVLTSTATFPTLADIFKFRPEETFAFTNYPDGYFERIWMHEYTGEAQKCAQLVDAAGQPTTVNLSLWNDTSDEMKKALGISITPPPPPDDLEARVTALEERVTILERDVATLAAIIRGEISMPFGKPFNATITLNGPEGGPQ